MLKEKIIQTALAFYSRYGIKGVSMSQIANAMSISKRTIYENFESKEDLLVSCLEYGTAKLRELVEEKQKQHKSSLELLLVISTDVIRYTSSFCPAFYKDALRYPVVTDRLNEYKGIFKEECKRYFLKGVEEGDFLPDQNYEFIATLFVEEYSKMKMEHHTNMIFTLLRGISTEKGFEKLKEYIPRASHNINQTINTI